MDDLNMSYFPTEGSSSVVYFEPFEQRKQVDIGIFASRVAGAELSKRAYIRARKGNQVPADGEITGCGQEFRRHACYSCLLFAHVYAGSKQR
jgi:hypothetical protein